MSLNPKTFQNVFTDESKGQFDELKVRHQGQMKDILTLLGSGGGGSGGGIVQSVEDGRTTIGAGFQW